MKKVICKLEEKEKKRSESIKIKEKAIKIMQDSLVDSLAELLETNKEFWFEMYEKYSLEKGKNYTVDNITGEIIEQD